MDRQHKLQLVSAILQMPPKLPSAFMRVQQCEFENRYNVCELLRESYEKNRDIVKLFRSSTPVVTVCLNVSGSANIGIIVRNADAFGGSEVHVLGRKFFDGRSVVGCNNRVSVKKSNAGYQVSVTNENKVQIDKNAHEFVDYLDNIADGHIIPVFVEQASLKFVGRQVPLSEIHEKLKVAQFGESNSTIVVIVGSESHGIPQEFIEASLQKFNDAFVTWIPQQGLVRSLNVAVAHSIVMQKLNER